MGGEFSAPVVDDDDFFGLPRLSAGVEDVDDALDALDIVLECSSETCLRNSISFENTL